MFLCQHYCKLCSSAWCIQHFKWVSHVSCPNWIVGGRTRSGTGHGWVSVACGCKFNSDAYLLESDCLYKDVALSCRMDVSYNFNVPKSELKLSTHSLSFQRLCSSLLQTHEFLMAEHISPARSNSHCFSSWKNSICRGFAHSSLCVCVFVLIKLL